MMWWLVAVWLQRFHAEVHECRTAWEVWQARAGREPLRSCLCAVLACAVPGHVRCVHDGCPPCRPPALARRGHSLLERAVDESAEGGALATCLGVMEQVQQQFFAQGGPPWLLHS